jgi:hypothetical protein
VIPVPWCLETHWKRWKNKWVPKGKSTLRGFGDCMGSHCWLLSFTMDFSIARQMIIPSCVSCLIGRPSLPKLRYGPQKHLQKIDQTLPVQLQSRLCTTSLTYVCPFIKLRDQQQGSHRDEAPMAVPRISVVQLLMHSHHPSL